MVCAWSVMVCVWNAMVCAWGAMVCGNVMVCAWSAMVCVWSAMVSVECDSLWRGHITLRKLGTTGLVEWVHNCNIAPHPLQTLWESFELAKKSSLRKDIKLGERIYNKRNSNNQR